jgi:hypothetical protein
VTHFLDDAGTAAIWAASIGIVIWIVQYSLLARWHRNFIGITMVGEALCILAIFIPSLMALADPADYAHFAQTTWYLWLSAGVVMATALFVFTRIATWEYIRRQRGAKSALSPGEMAARMAALEAENISLRELLGEIPGT